MLRGQGVPEQLPKNGLVPALLAAEIAALAQTNIKTRELAGEAITAVLDHAPGNGAAIGGTKLVTENGWFATRTSGTEDIYKIDAESFNGTEHLQRILEEAQTIVDQAIAAP